jgi:dTDP-4-dehydrorhamnose reductase
LKHTTEIVNKYNPDIILNFAALVDLEYCEEEKDDCYLTNTIGAIHLFNLCKDLNIPYVFISTAGIFGNDKEFYTEDDQPIPLSAYGKSKFYTEELLQNQGYKKYWIFRAGWMMGGGPNVDKKFVNKIIKQIISGKKELNVVDDKLGVPTYTKDFALSILKHIENNLPYGLYNMVSQGEASRYETAVEINNYLELNLQINKVDSDFFKDEYFVKRPYSEKLINKALIELGRNYMRDWKTCLHEYLDKFYRNIEINKPFLSIAIPSYGYNGSGVSFLENNFKILETQTFKDFEIVVSDHSIDDNIEILCKDWSNRLNINYLRNENGRGIISPNINNALLNCKGEWIKILYQDDFLFNNESLEKQYNFIKNNNDTNWFATNFCHTNDGVNFHRYFHPKWVDNIWTGNNLIGCPSVITIKNDNIILFDNELNWLMDCDYYQRFYKKHGEPKILNEYTVVNRDTIDRLTNTISDKQKYSEYEKLKEMYDNC